MKQYTKQWDVHLQILAVSESEQFNTLRSKKFLMQGGLVYYFK